MIIDFGNFQASLSFFTNEKSKGPTIRGITPRHFIRDMENSILGIRSFDEKIDFRRNNNKSFVDMTILKMDFFVKIKFA